jgi:hypothetical protein
MSSSSSSSDSESESDSDVGPSSPPAAKEQLKPTSHDDEGREEGAPKPADNSSSKDTDPRNSLKGQQNVKTKKQNPSKKKRRKQSRSEVELEWKRERYQKLRHQATKDFTKTSKQVKQFLCQKIIRKLKDDSKSSRQTMEQELATMKAFDVNAVVERAFKQLGMPHLDPDWSPELSSTNVVGQQANNEKEQKRIVDKYIQHKKMTSALEEWNEKVTEYRRWCLRLDEKNDPFYEAPSKGKKKRRKGNQAKTESLEYDEAANFSLDTSTFCSLGGGGGAGDDDENTGEEGTAAMSAYGPGAFMDDDGAMFVTKKNRKGQRARRAKAQALEAKKAGRKYVSSNWREPKKTAPNDGTDECLNQQSHLSQGQRRGHSVSASKTHMNAEQKDAAQAHPSWAAKQNQSAGIVAFQGKKITF